MEMLVNSGFNETQVKLYFDILVFSYAFTLI